jgi:hypothetical protein
MRDAVRPSALSGLRLVILILTILQIGAWVGTVQRASALPLQAGGHLVQYTAAAPIVPGSRCLGLASLNRSCVPVVVHPASAVPDAPPAGARILPRPVDMGLRGRTPTPEPPPPRALT